MLAPARARVDCLKVKASRRKHVAHRNVAVVSLNDFHAGMQRVNHRAHFLEIVLADQILLVDDERRAEFNLLHEQRRNVLLAHRFLAQQRVAAAEFVHEPRRVHHANHVVKPAVLDKLQFLRNRHRLAHAARLNHNVVVFSRLDQILNVLGKLAFERAANAAVRERHDARRVGNLRAVRNQLLVHVHLADVIHDDRNLVALLIVQHLIQKRRLTRTQIPAQQRHRSHLLRHYHTSIFPVFF